jgi:hypothetical protein
VAGADDIVNFVYDRDKKVFVEERISRKSSSSPSTKKGSKKRKQSTR